MTILNKISTSFNFADILTLVEELYEEGLLSSADMWLSEAQKTKDYKNSSSSHRQFNDLQNKIEETKQTEDEMERFEKLCSVKKTSGFFKTFQNATTRCRYISDGKNPLVVMKLEELSQEPIVNVIHNFLTAEEVNTFLLQSLKYNFDFAPVIGHNHNDDVDSEDSFLGGRVAKSYYVEEEKDIIGIMTKKIKSR